MNTPNQFSMEDAMRLANSPAGKQLIAMLQRQNSADLNKAMASAASGNYEDAKTALSAMLKDPTVMELLKQIGG